MEYWAKVELVIKSEQPLPEDLFRAIKELVKNELGLRVKEASQTDL